MHKNKKQYTDELECINKKLSCIFSLYNKYTVMIQTDAAVRQYMFTL